MDFGLSDEQLQLKESARVFLGKECDAKKLRQFIGDDEGFPRDLYSEIQRTAGQPLELRIASLRPRVDLFFDKVLVNAPDPAIRRNRLALLHSLLQEFSMIADFSEIVTERETR